MVPEHKEEDRSDDELERGEDETLAEDEAERARAIQNQFFDDDPFADEGDLDYEAEPSF